VLSKGQEKNMYPFRCWPKMKEKQAPSQSGLAPAATNKRSSRGMAAGKLLASEATSTCCL